VVGVSESVRAQARINDETLAEWLDEQESKSETVREALRLYRLQHESVEDDRLTGAQRSAYQWLREQAGVGGTVRLEVAQTVLAQTLSRDKDLIKYTVLQPLENLGYVEVNAGIRAVRVTVLPPEDDADERLDLEVDDPEEAGERLDELAAAGEEVSGRAD
jgi:hypothetical protein